MDVTGNTFLNNLVNYSEIIILVLTGIIAFVRFEYKLKSLQRHIEAYFSIDFMTQRGQAFEQLRINNIEIKEIKEEITRINARYINCLKEAKEAREEKEKQK